VRSPLLLGIIFTGGISLILMIEALLLDPPHWSLKILAIVVALTPAAFTTWVLGGLWRMEGLSLSRAIERLRDDYKGAP
jgi:hypothetical protein